MSLLACSAPVREMPPARPAELVPVAWADIPGWTEDDHGAAYAAFLASCEAVLGARSSTPLASVCQSGREAGRLDGDSARAFFEAHFAPRRIDGGDGLITGYYVPVIAGAPAPTPELRTPLYAPPANLAYTREEIEIGALEGQGLELVWVDPIDAFFAQIQGSARVRLPDGRVLKLEYAAKNTHPYTAVGRILVARGVVAREAMDMQRLREWMSANPDDAITLRRENKAFVFFRASPASQLDQAVGAQGVALVPQRSIAVDSALYAYGTPFFIDAALPIDGAQPTTPFRQLMIAMDTGSAIVGPARADIYWGVGAEAARIAGRFKQRGTFTLLVAVTPAVPNR